MSRFETLCPEYLKMSPSEAAEFYMQDLGDASDEQLEYLQELHGNLAESLRGEQNYDEPPGEAEQREHVADCHEAIHIKLMNVWKQRLKEPDDTGSNTGAVVYESRSRAMNTKEPDDAGSNTGKMVYKSRSRAIDAPEPDDTGSGNEPVETESGSVRADVIASSNAYGETEVSEVSSCQAPKKPRRQRSTVASEEPAPPPQQRKKKGRKPKPKPNPVPLPCRELCQGRFEDGWRCDSLVAVSTTTFDTSKTEIGYNVAQWLNAVEGATMGSIVGWEALSTAAPAAASAGSKAFGGLAIAGGAIDLVISLRRLANTSQRIHDVKKIVREHTEAGEDGVEARIAAYALKKKWRKLRRTLLATGLATVAIASGVVGLAVAGPVGWGIALGLAVFGILGAAGFLAYRYHRHKKKEEARDKRVETYVDHLLGCAERGVDNAAARMMPNASSWGRAVRDRNRVMLINKLIKLDLSERFLMASALVGLFLEDWTRIRREAKQAEERGEGDEYEPDEPTSYTLLSAINAKPHKVAAAFTKALDQTEESNDDQPIKDCYEKHVRKVLGKLKSW